MVKTALVCGAGGFIGNHLVSALKAEGVRVRGVDLKRPEFGDTQADEFMVGDLRDQDFVAQAIGDKFDEIYQLAADMGGAGFVFTGDNDADIMHNSMSININVLDACKRSGNRRIFYSSSACIYPEENQLDAEEPNCEESSAYPANPDSDYGWEKLFSERLYQAFARNYGMDCRIARYHNIFGPLGTWRGGREKAPAALCRKVAEAKDGETIEIWGDGQQTRTFLYVDECVEGTLKLMRSDVTEPVNIGSDELISINALADQIARIAGKNIQIQNIPGPAGVRGRSSNNKLIADRLGWAPQTKLVDGLRQTYAWISKQVADAQNHG